MQKQAQREQNTFHIFRVISRLLLTFTALIGAFFLVCIALARAMQQEELRNRIRSFNKRRLNPLTLTIAGNRFRIYGCVKHVGRRSGQHYKTPVVTRPLGDGFIIPLPYGADVDWCRNVMAAGTCSLLWNGREYILEHPEIITPTLQYPETDRRQREIPVQPATPLHKSDSTRNIPTMSSGNALGSYPLVQRIIFASGGIVQYLLLHQKKESLVKTIVTM
jgi:hypothetical protein